MIYVNQQIPKGAFFQSGGGERIWILMGIQMPNIPGIRYESKKKTGVIEFWSDTAIGRDSYLGQFGKRELARLSELTYDERAAEVAEFIANKMVEKGIKLSRA